MFAKQQQQQQQQHSFFSQASWGRLEMKPERNKDSIPFFPPPICTRRTAMSFVYENNLLLPSSDTFWS